MRGITEERLREVLDSTSRKTSKDLLRVLINECTELNTWQPIETAPKDRRILLFYPIGISYIGMVCEGEYYPIETPIRMEPEQPTHWVRITGRSEINN